jgi:hypothetical protein
MAATSGGPGFVSPRRRSDAEKRGAFRLNMLFKTRKLGNIDSRSASRRLHRELALLMMIQTRFRYFALATLLVHVVLGGCSATEFSSGDNTDDDAGASGGTAGTSTAGAAGLASGGSPAVGGAAGQGGAAGSAAAAQGGAGTGNAGAGQGGQSEGGTGGSPDPVEPGTCVDGKITTLTELSDYITCDNYCAAFMALCACEREGAAFANTADCITICQNHNWATGDTSGVGADTLGCRVYHANAGHRDRSGPGAEALVAANPKYGTNHCRHSGVHPSEICCGEAGCAAPGTP